MDRRPSQPSAPIAGKKVPPRRARPAEPDAAFDIWLSRKLRRIFDDVLDEPLPPDISEVLSAGGRRNRKD